MIGMNHLVSRTCIAMPMRLGLVTKTSSFPAIQASIHHNKTMSSSYHSSITTRGLEEFYEEKKPNEVYVTGRAWTAADLRRKSFDDLHSLWYVLYKERNLLLSEKEKRRRMKRPTSHIDESRYSNVKRSMGAVKFVLDERRKIKVLIENASAETKTSQ